MLYQNIEQKNTNNAGIGFFGLLQVIFIAGKVFGFLDWSWWLVFIPTFVSIGIAVLAIIIAFLIAVFAK
jgi:hypothetical protein